VPYSKPKEAPARTKANEPQLKSQSSQKQLHKKQCKALLTEEDLAPPPVALLPISATSKLPHPLGKAAPPNYTLRTREWFEDCKLPDARFIQLFAQALSVPATQRDAVQRITCKHMQCSMKVSCPPLFAHEYSVPTKVQERISVRAKNPMTLPCPIHKNRGLLNMVDLNVWYWSHRIAPVTNRGHFFRALWDMFNIPGNWHQLAGPGNWNVPNTTYL